MASSAAPLAAVPASIAGRFFAARLSRPSRAGADMCHRSQGPWRSHGRRWTAQRIIRRYQIVDLPARAARADVEAALDARGWPWSLALSRWVDMLVVLEERTS